MESKKISELPESTDVYDGCCFPVVTNGETKKMTYALLKERMKEDMDIDGAIEEYLEEHPSGMTEEERYQLNKNTEDIGSVNSEMSNKQPRDMMIPYGSEVNPEEIIQQALDGRTCNVVDLDANEFAIMSRVDMSTYKLIFMNDAHLYTISIVDGSWDKEDVPRGGGSVDAYTKTESDAKYQEKGSYMLSSDRITKDQADFIESVTSANKFDKTQEAMNGKYFTYSGTITSGSSSLRSYYIPIEPGTFSFPVLNSYMGTNALRITLFKEDKTFLKWVQGTNAGTYDSDILCSVTISDADYQAGARYVGFTTWARYLEQIMFVKGSYPSSYMAYGKLGYRFKDVNDKGNVLFGKTVVFDGDSICNASSETSETTRGYAYRIGSRNGMNWTNVAVGGGTISNVVADKHHLCDYIDTIHSNNSDLDYLILEGGTNDADHHDDVPIGTFTYSDFSGNFDTSTFSGALEKLFYKATTYYPGTKIGYIVAMKMTRYGTGYDASTNVRRQYFEKAIAICKKWGIPYLDLWEGCPLNPMNGAHYNPSLSTDENKAQGYYYTDGQHLTAKGYEVIAPKIEAWMRTL